MFHPVSAHPYHFLNRDKQILVCTLSRPCVEATEKWKDRAAAAFEFKPGDDLMDIVRDLLANPQIRIIVFDGAGPARDVFAAFKNGGRLDLQGVAENHVDAVRQFVDFFDEDCFIRDALQPFWPTRLKYERPKEGAE